MNKRRNLADQIKSKAMSKTTDIKVHNVNHRIATSSPKSKSPQSPSRVGKSFLGGYFPPEVAKQMKLLAVEQETTIQALTAEALNHLFAAYGKPEIAPSKE